MVFEPPVFGHDVVVLPGWIGVDDVEALARRQCLVARDNLLDLRLAGHRLADALRDVSLRNRLAGGSALIDVGPELLFGDSRDLLAAVRLTGGYAGGLECFILPSAGKFDRSACTASRRLL